MKKPDLESTIVAGLAGALLLSVCAQMWDDCFDPQCFGSDRWTLPATGFAVGAGVQIGVRALGVS